MGNRHRRLDKFLAIAQINSFLGLYVTNLNIVLELGGCRESVGLRPNSVSILIHPNNNLRRSMGLRKAIEIITWVRVCFLISLAQASRVGWIIGLVLLTMYLCMNPSSKSKRQQRLRKTFHCCRRGSSSESTESWR